MLDPSRQVPAAGHDTAVRVPPGTTAIALDHLPTGDGCVVDVVVMAVVDVVDLTDSCAAGVVLHDTANRESRTTRAAASASVGNRPRTTGSKGPIPRPGDATTCPRR